MPDDLLAAVEAAAGLAVYGGVPAAARRELVAGLFAGDNSDRPQWADAYRRSRDLLPQLAELCAELADLDEVVVGAPATAASAIARTLDVPLTVLPDDPPRLRDAVGNADRLARTVVVLTGGDDYLREAFWAAHRRAGRTDAEASRHFVVVDGPFDGVVTVPGDPELTGPWAALTAAALVPAALAGVDVVELLDEAELFAPSLESEQDNPALALGVALASADGTVAVRADGTGLEGLGEWVAELLAGVVPVVVDGPGDRTVTYGGSLLPGTVPGGGVQPDLAVNGPLGAQFLAWQYACAVAARVTGRGPRPGDGTAARS